jgi:hypothetical protein
MTNEPARVRARFYKGLGVICKTTGGLGTDNPVENVVGEENSGT